MAAACAGVAASYVAAVQLAGGPRAARDDPSVAARRSAAALAASALCWLPCALAGRFAAACLRSTLLQPPFAPAAAALALCLALFAAPLLLAFRDSRAAATTAAPTWHASRGPASSSQSQPQAHPVLRLRNLLVAPLTEEWAFRACMAPLLLSQRWRPAHVALVCPLFFGAAHAHHALNLRFALRWPWRRIAAATASQLAYTTPFGALATALLLRGGSLAAPVAAHALCNALGVPDLRRVSREAPAALGVGVASFSAGLWLYLRQPWAMAAGVCVAAAQRSHPPVP